MRSAKTVLRFVTLKTASGQLRGCIGSAQAHRPLAVDVAENAYKAGVQRPSVSAGYRRRIRHVKAVHLRTQSADTDADHRRSRPAQATPPRRRRLGNFRRQPARPVLTLGVGTTADAGCVFGPTQAQSRDGDKPLVRHLSSQSLYRRRNSRSVILSTSLETLQTVD